MVDTWKIKGLETLTCSVENLYVTTVGPPHRQITNHGVRDRFELYRWYELQSVEKNLHISGLAQFKSCCSSQLCIIHHVYQVLYMAFKNPPNLTPISLSSLASSSSCFCFIEPYMSTVVLRECTSFWLENSSPSSMSNWLISTHPQPSYLSNISQGTLFSISGLGAPSTKNLVFYSSK